jgi:hypothetical protein
MEIGSSLVKRVLIVNFVVRDGKLKQRKHISSPELSLNSLNENSLLINYLNKCHNSPHSIQSICPKPALDQLIKENPNIQAGDKKNEL